ncbi:hypothetical protein [Lacticaseibacillus jixiensis]|uniref:hypothetical protein n=1 Tax=Lacticaseibacillus jixiensis TaxID=3231926 RepID=UPI0036F41C9C
MCVIKVDLNWRKLTSLTILFWIVFIIIGDAYIFHLDGQANSSDYQFTAGVTRQQESAYERDLAKQSRQLNLKVFVVDYEVTGKQSAKYTIYTFEENKRFMQQRLQLYHDNNHVNSLLNGSRQVVFKPFKQRTVKSNYRKMSYFAFGSQSNVNKLRQRLIDQYGLSRPQPNRYKSDALGLILAAWLLAASVVLLSTFFEVARLRKETLIRYLNGADFPQIIRPLIRKNSLLMIISAGTGVLLAMSVTTAQKFWLWSLLAISLLIICSDMLFLKLRHLKLKETFALSYYPRSYQILNFATLFLTIITLLVTLNYSFKNMADAAETIRQGESWQRFADYDNVYFIFKDFTAKTNPQTDQAHAIEFYNQNLDRYQMHLAFDFGHNGGSASSRIDQSESFVYLNKYAKTDLRQIGLDPGDFAANRFYLISQYSLRELQERHLFGNGDSKSEDTINNLLPNVHLTKYNCQVHQLNKSYRFVVHDINMANLADNVHRNPVILLDTHDHLPASGQNPLQFSGFHVFDSLVKFHHSDDFARFLRQIGYQNQYHYKHSVLAIYSEKRADKMLLLVINLILSLLLLILFNFSLTIILHLDFKARSVEIALGKIFGRNLFQRYRGLLTLVLTALGVSCLLFVLANQFLYNFSLWYGTMALVVVLINLGLSISFFIRHYERISIPRVLKGGN